MVTKPTDPDLSGQDSEYTENKASDGESTASPDNMSLVSGSEIQGLEDDLKDFVDDGYNTETTANTSPSHKRQKPMQKSRARAQEHITSFYASTSASFS